MFISVSSQTTLDNVANFFVFALYDATAPGVVLESQQPPKPYGNPLQVTFNYNCLNGRVYIIKLWESVDATPTGTVRNSFSQTVNQNSVLVRLDEYLQVDVTSGFVSGVTVYNNTTYQNWDYSVERKGFGTMTPEFAGHVESNYRQLLTGGIELLQDGDTFQPEEEFIVRFTVQVVIPAPSGTPSGSFGNGRVITVDEILTGVDVNTALIIQSDTIGISIGLPPLGTVADFSFIYLYSTGGNHNLAAIKTDGADLISYKGADKGTVYLGQMEVLKLFKFAGKWWPDCDLPGVRMVGELLYNYGLSELNTVSCNGTELGRADYARLWEWVQTLDAASIVTEASWQGTFITHPTTGISVYNKRQCFSTGDGSTTFRLPLLSNIMLKGIAARSAGSLEFDNNLQHSHNVDDMGSLSPGGIYIKGKWHYANGGAGTIQGVAVTFDTGGPENIVRNAGAYCLIRY